MDFAFAAQIESGTIDCERSRELHEGLSSAAQHCSDVELAATLSGLTAEIAAASLKRWGFRGRHPELGTCGCTVEYPHEFRPWFDGTAESFLKPHVIPQHHTILALLSKLGSAMVGYVDETPDSDHARIIWSSVGVARRLLNEIHRLVPEVLQEGDTTVLLADVHDNATLAVCVGMRRCGINREVDEEAWLEAYRAEEHACRLLDESMGGIVRIASRAIGVLPESAALQEQY